MSKLIWCNCVFGINFLNICHVLQIDGRGLNQVDRPGSRGYVDGISQIIHYLNTLFASFRCTPHCLDAQLCQNSDSPFTFLRILLFDSLLRPLNHFDMSIS